MIKFPIKVRGERHFHPFHLLIESAEELFEKLKEYQFGGASLAISTILLSALALEGLVNSLGESKVKQWSDFESSKLIGKIRIICGELDVEYQADNQPWQHIGWLVKLRNQLAHARPQKININEEIEEDDLEVLLMLGPSKLELEISVENVERALRTVTEIRNIFLSKLDPEYDDAFFVPH